MCVYTGLLSLNLLKMFEDWPIISEFLNIICRRFGPLEQFTKIEQELNIQFQKHQSPLEMD